MGTIGCGQNIGNHFLGGGLSNTAGHTDDLTGMGRPVASCQCAQRLHGIIHEHSRNTGAHLLVGHNSTCALFQRLTDKNMAVKGISQQGDKQLARLNAPAVGAYARDFKIGKFRRDRTVAPLSGLLECQHISFLPAQALPDIRQPLRAHPDGILHG